VNARPTLVEAEAAVEQVREAIKVIGRVRDVQVQVRCAWQQIDDLPEEDAAELKRRIAAVTREYLNQQMQAVRPHFDVKATCHPSAEINGITMSLPMIYQEPGVTA
jgi:CHAD domain-containing protein